MGCGLLVVLSRLWASVCHVYDSLSYAGVVVMSRADADTVQSYVVGTLNP